MSAADPAFDNPTKFVGEVLRRGDGAALGAERGWTVKPDGPHWRRVVPSPMPQRVVETRIVRLLLNSGAVVVCAGAAASRSIRDEAGKLQGVEAVVDKDLTAAVLAEALEADALLLLTDVPCGRARLRNADAEPITRATPAGAAARALRRPGRWAPRSRRCADSSRSPAIMAAIGALQDAAAILAGTAGHDRHARGRLRGAG